MTSWVTLNVGGQKFVTNTFVFMKDPESLLAKMFNGKMNPGERDLDGAIVIDRSPDYFKPILNYFRTGEIVIDTFISAEGVLQEAKYYRIQSLIAKLSIMTSWVTLNVGGQKFITETSVFMKEPECMLAKMVNGQMKDVEKDQDGTILIDRSPDYFKPILNYFRTGEILMDPSSTQAILQEAKYYGIESLIAKLSKKNSWVTLNVGGKKFVTNTSVFMKEPDCMLAKMFNGEMRPGEKDQDGAILIDRSPDYFKPILNYFRTGEVIIDPSISAEGVLQEAKYYGIESLIPKLQDYESDADMTAAKIKNIDENLNLLSSALSRIDKSINSVTVSRSSPQSKASISVVKKSGY